MIVSFPGDFPLNKLPTVTVLIANFNYGRFLPGCLKSVFAQTYPKLNLLVIDDCSTDDSWDILKKDFFKLDHKKIEQQNITILSTKVGNINFSAAKLHEHVSVSQARNIGIDLVSDITDYYQILDADDEMYPEKVSELAAGLYAAEAIGVTYGDYNILNVETGNIITEYKEPFDRMRLVQECIVHSGAMIRKKVLFDVKDEWGYYNSQQRVAEDYDLWLRISEKNMICHIPSILSLVRVHKDNSTNSVRQEQWQKDWQLTFNRFKQRNG